MLKNWSTKKKVLALIAVIVVGGLVINGARGKETGKEYETAKVLRGDLLQTVEATGKITAESDLDLRFEMSGTITALNVREGQLVRKGTLLANLRLSELNAQVAQANANLQLKLAGLSPADQQYYQAAVDAARAAYEEAVNTTVQSYEAFLTALQGGVPKLDDALTQADNILGIDNPFANESFKQQLSGRDKTKLSFANAQYPIAKAALQNFKTQVNTVTASDKEGLKATVDTANTAVKEMQILLSAVSEVLRQTAPQGELTQSALDTKKSTIETTRTTITTAQSTVATAAQTASAAESGERSKYAALVQAEANFNSKNGTPRDVDVASLRAALAAAVAAREKAMLRAPIDGVISKVNKHVGETVSTADAIVKLTTEHFEIKVDVPETDVPKLTVGDQAVITLDALGNDIRLAGTVTSIQPASTEIQDVVYYKVSIALNQTPETVKPGMTANIIVYTNSREGVLYIPTRTVRSDEDGNKYVRVLENGTEKEVTVKLGLRANEGKIEVLEGLTEGQEVIVSVKEKK